MRMLKDTKVEDLLEAVLNKSVYPQNHYEVAAIIESLGWNDDRVAKTFGIADVFELSEVIWEMIKQRINYESFEEEEKIGPLDLIIDLVRSFLRGVIFAMPMAISVIAMLTLRFSLWSYKYLSTEKATAIAIGTILSFMAVGGFTQAIARRGFFYTIQGYYEMARRTTFSLIRIGYIYCIVIAIIFILLNLFFPIFPVEILIISIVYYFFLCSNWLSVTVMYILRKEFIFTGLISLGIFIVYILFKLLKLDIIFAQIIALIVVSILGLLLVIYFFKRDESSMEKGLAPSLPKRSIVLYLLTPYFLYGFLYFSFLFTDRLIAWTTDGVSMPYFIWFRGDYELGLDFALLMLILPMGFSEVIVNRLLKNIGIIQKYGLKYDKDNVNKEYLRGYIRNTILISIVSAMSAIIVYIVVMYIGKRNATADTDFLFSETTKFVFIYALISYSILCVALNNAVILFSLSQVEMVKRSMYLVVIINFIVGFILSRWLGYEYAVFGLLVSTIAFYILTTKSMIKVMKSMDYYIYTSM